jgi:hypothetical protein
MPFYDPTLDEQSPTKLLLIGDSGKGKTGSLISLIEAGYNLRILDYDNGIEILKKMLRKKNNPELFQRLHWVTLTDPSKSINGRAVPMATAWDRGMRTLENYPDGLGKIETWTNKEVLVVDSLNFAGKAALRVVQSINNRLADIPQIQDYLTAQSMVERFCGLLYSDSIKCNVVVLSHVREIGKTRTEMDSKGRPIQIEEADSRQGFAETGTGKALSPTIGRYFNAVLLADTEGSGQSTRYVIRTVPHNNVGCKTPAPGIVKPKYPLETGLASYFADVRGTTPSTQETSNG